MTRLSRYYGYICEKEKQPGGAYPGVSLRTLRVIGGPSGRSRGRFAARQVVAKTSTRLRVWRWTNNCEFSIFKNFEDNVEVISIRGIEATLPKFPQKGGALLHW